VLTRKQAGVTSARRDLAIQRRELLIAIGPVARSFGPQKAARQMRCVARGDLAARAERKFAQLKVIELLRQQRIAVLFTKDL